MNNLNRPQNAQQLIDYQSGSVVSKTILKSKTGTVTLFAFDRGEGLSEHTAPFDALVFLLDGKAEVIISGKSHNLNSGEMIILPANEPHALKAKVRFKMMLVMIRN
ncbi:MAG: cupin domain-containing protein [Candidatus Marinimicrobia bacterium]|nr:cupin domain-containing protein [Candidatus Neomarinimicrobiota bacterium]